VGDGSVDAANSVDGAVSAGSDESANTAMHGEAGGCGCNTEAGGADALLGLLLGAELI